MPNEVRKGQVWSVLFETRGVQHFEVDEIEPPKVHGHIGSTPVTISLSVLQRGRRAAHLISEPAGSDRPSELCPRSRSRKKDDRSGTGAYFMTAIERRTASEAVKVTAPRGLLKKNPRKAQAFDMFHEDGWDYARLARFFGVSRSAITRWMADERARRKDEAMMARIGMGATGT